MLFHEIIGQEPLKKYLEAFMKSGRIPHTQLFVGKEGCGTLFMAIAYAQQLLCSSSENAENCALKCRQLQHPDLFFAVIFSKNYVT